MGNKGAGARARAVLLAGHERPNDVIAAAAGVDVSTVRAVRRQLEAAGQITRWRVSSRAESQPIPPMPLALLQRGSCTRHPQPGLWSSQDSAEQEAAAHVCASCPVLALCAAWRDQVPPIQRRGVVLAGEYTKTRHQVAS